MDFIDQLKQIINNLSKDIVIGLFSATLKQEITNLINEYLINPTYVEIENNTNNKQITQYYMRTKNKFKQITNIIFNYNPDITIIFCNTQKEVDNVFEYLKCNSFNVQRLHGGLKQDDRIRIINGIKKKRFRILVATDVAGRGIDIDKVSLVINYDLPNNSNNYLHRIGRTGRINHQGIAYSLVDDNELLDKIIKETNNNIIENNIYDSKEKDIIKYFTLQLDTIAIPSEIINNEITRLHINAGKQHKLRPIDIVGSICSIPNIESNDIGIISVNEVVTFVEILNNKGKLVHDALQTKPIKAKIRKVNYANEEWFNKG